MTKIYLGNQQYEIHIGHRKLTLTCEELDEMQEDIVGEMELLTNELNEKIDEVEDLRLKVSELDDVVSDLETQIVEYEAEKEHE